jgi:F420-dependent methylenetetrahydromethanopterin dehydrogenase
MYGTAYSNPYNKNKSMTVIPRNALVGSVSSNKVFVVENSKAVLKTVVAGRILG